MLIHSLGAFVTAALLMACEPVQLTQDGWRTDFSRHTVPLEEIVAGGPPKDGIPAIDKPFFESVRSAAKWLDQREPVIVVERAGQARAYPYRILIWHEIVNDRLAGLPIAVTYCPLCNTALVFERGLAGRVHDFGTTGRLRHSDLVMYDRQTETWWQQATGEAIVGELAGQQLKFVPSQTVSWREFKQAHPRGEVLSQRTGFARPYGENPYVGYDNPAGSPIAGLFKGRNDNRLPAMERVAALNLGKETVAYPFSRLRAVRVVNDRVNGEPVVVFWAAGTASALDRAQITAGRDIGATGIFSRTLKGRVLTFEAARNALFRDRETNTTWNLLGGAVAGPLQGEQLRRLAHGDYFWFAWAAFRPQTRVWQE
ncbi:MAG: DUF3179 domain-containing protein [Gemmatimonadota bacterium]